ncbi:MAG: response regulator transcription factor [Corynebacterium sp.]|nr:response regulator transcription factor [Corynebacterium sp.]
MTTVLIVEDEENLAEPLAFLLHKEGFEAIIASDGATALETFDTTPIDLVLLDLMLPGMSGTDVLRELRRISTIPVIMVTAKDSELDKVLGLELGADDYVTKPYSSRELIARIKAVLRRGRVDNVLETGRINLDVDSHQVTVDGKAISMPLKEFDLLEYLMRNADHVLTRAQLIERIWGYDYVGDTKTLDVHIKRLRSKIEVDPSNPTAIITVRGLGYKFVGAQ